MVLSWKREGGGKGGAFHERKRKENFFKFFFKRSRVAYFFVKRLPCRNDDVGILFSPGKKKRKTSLQGRRGREACRASSTELEGGGISGFRA